MTFLTEIPFLYRLCTSPIHNIDSVSLRTKYTILSVRMKRNRISFVPNNADIRPLLT